MTDDGWQDPQLFEEEFWAARDAEINKRPPTGVLLLFWTVLICGLLAAILLVGVFTGSALAHEDVTEDKISWPTLTDQGREGLRFCESTNDYTSVHYETIFDGSTQRVSGAYQFVQPTWDAAVLMMHEQQYMAPYNWKLWAGVPPNEAPGMIQDHVAHFWWHAEDPRTQFGCYQAAIDAMAYTPDKRVSKLVDVLPPRWVATG